MKIEKCGSEWVEIPLWSGFVHFLTRYAESFTNLVSGSMRRVFTSDIFSCALRVSS